MTRKEIYQKIKKEDLADEIKDFFGKNYTNVKTSLLEDWITTTRAIEEIKVPNYSKSSKDITKFVENKMDHILENSRKFNKPETIKEDNFCDSCSLYDGFQQLVSMLVAHRALTPIEGEELMDVVFK